MRDIVLAMTGASGAPYALRLLEQLIVSGRTVRLVVSPAGSQVLLQETGVRIDLDRFDPQLLLHAAGLGEPSSADRLIFHDHRNFMAGIASGSFLTGGMVICPCSMGTLASLANGLSSNLIHRAANVHLKERRPLIIVPRETPLDEIQLENMRKLAAAGVVMLPAMPGFYQRPQQIGDLVDFVVGRILDQLGIAHQLFKRWGETSDRKE